MTLMTVSELSGLKLHSRGKVRDIYDLGAHLLLVATDRVSAFDVILPNPIPHKGAVLAQLSRFWFERTRHIASNHLVSTDPAEMPTAVRAHSHQLDKRAMYVRKAKRIDIECVVRGYLAGSGWKEYRERGTVCGQKLPAGLRESDRLPEPIFTPATKADTGHDENISVERMAELVGHDLTERLTDLSIKIYQFGAKHSESKGILLADTKFEFGFIDSELSLIDEAMTPDSSRFWPADRYEPGHGQPSFDKQPIRDWLESTGWDKKPPAPPLPEEIVQQSSRRYIEAYECITGEKWEASAR